jgi:hypothetical protein
MEIGKKYKIVSDTSFINYHNLYMKDVWVLEYMGNGFFVIKECKENNYHLINSKKTEYEEIEN